MRYALPLLLALLVLPAPAPGAPPAETPGIDDLSRALISADVKTSWDAARVLVERPTSDSKAIRTALAALVKDAGLEIEVPRSVKRAGRGSIIDRIRQAALYARLTAKRIEMPPNWIAVPGGVAPRAITREAVLVADFWLSRTEVSREDFARFVATGGHAPEGEGFLADWNDGAPSTGTAKHPVVHVSRRDAAAYAKWSHFRLPTAEEWLIARGGCGRTPEPWGKQHKVGLANVMDRQGARGTEPVEGRLEGATPLGILRLGGNVAEWTSSPWGDSKERGIAAGESFLTVPAFRTAVLVATRATTRRRDLGFRCAWTIPDRPPR